MLEPQKRNKNLPASRTLLPAGSKGISIIELMVVAVIIGVALSALLSFGSFSVRTASLLKQTTQAKFLAEDAIEALKNYRDNTGWMDDDPADEYDGLGVAATGVALHLELSQDAVVRWQLLSGQETLGIFTREVVLEPAERDGSDNIVQTGGTPDPDTKRIVVTVSWQQRGAAREIQAITYLTNWR